jgi:PhnB protein
LITLPARYTGSLVNVEAQMKVDAYVQFGGRAAEAVTFYGEHLGATVIQAMPFRGSPASAMAPEAWQDKILHLSLQVGNSLLLGSDGMPGQTFNGMQGCALALSVDSVGQAERIFAALAQDGTVSMPLAPSFLPNASACWSTSSASAG